MTKVSKKIFLIATCIFACFLWIYQGFNPISNHKMTLIFDRNIMTSTAYIVIAAYLFYYIYREVSKEQHELTPVIEAGVMFFLGILMVMNLFAPVPKDNLEFYISFRMVALAVLVVVAEGLIVKERNITRYFCVFISLMLMLVLVWLLNASLFSMLLTLSYLMGAVYLLAMAYLHEITNEEPLKAFLFVLILMALVYDLFQLTRGQISIEMCFVVPALGILTLYIHRGYKKVSRVQSLVQEKEALIKDNAQLLKTQHRNMDSVEVLKNELSYKFMKKQQHFENLEIAVDVLKGSILIINDAFKIEFAHGDVMENSAYDDIIGMDVSQAIFDLASDEGQYFKSVVVKIFNAVDDVREQMYISLLDGQLTISNQVYDMQYDVIEKRDGKKVLLLHADMINEFSHQGAMLLREKEISQMVITVAKYGEVFFSDLATYIYFARHIEEYLDLSATIQEKIFKYLRRLHTFKGVFDQYNMQSTVVGLNDVENELLNMLHHTENLKDAELVQTLKSYDLEGLAQPDLNIVKEKLGDKYLENKRKISVDGVKYNRFAMALKETLGQDHELVSTFKHLTFVDVKDVLRGYKAYIMRIAQEQGKYVDFKVTGDTIKVRRDSYIHFFESLIHLFKNSVIHGLEYPDQRREVGKSEVGHILCHLQNLNNTMVLTISDDGRGVDIKEIKNRLFIAGRYTMEALNDLSDDLVSNMILEDGMSVGDQTGIYSGRGVGMSCIKEVVENLGGQSKVRSQKNQGVAYDLSMPLDSKSRVRLFDVEAIQKVLTLEAEKILTKNPDKTDVSHNWRMNKDECGQGLMLDVSAHLTIQGIRDTHVCISADEKMLKHLIDHYGLYGHYKGMSLKMMNEALCVFAEAVTENTVQKLQSARQAIEILSPNLISEKTYERVFLGREGGISQMNLGEGQLTLVVLSAKVRKGA